MANANRTLYKILRANSRDGTELKWTWAEVMEQALYSPECGYYRHQLPSIGKAGDFYTSVSVGQVFGQLLAAFIFHEWRERGGVGPLQVVEQGAHHGTLAKDVWQALVKCDAGLASELNYWIIEPDPSFQALQRQTFEDLPQAKLHHVGAWSELPPMDGFFLGNELLDAFPVHRVIWYQGAWHEQYVESPDGLTWQWTIGELSDPRLLAACEGLGKDFPESYQTEVHLAAQNWIQEVAKSAFQGSVVLLDYGYTDAEYYSPERMEGTLRRYHQHQCDGKVLEQLGECDLTAHVNFTAIAREAEVLGLRVGEFMEQGRFLTQVATKTVLKSAMAPDPSWVRQFMTLTHPSHLGHSFRVLTLSKGGDIGQDAASLSDVARARLGLTTEY